MKKIDSPYGRMWDTRWSRTKKSEERVTREVKKSRVPYKTILNCR